MSGPMRRRQFLRMAALVAPAAVAMKLEAQSTKTEAAQKPAQATGALSELYPAQSSEMVREMVTVSHFDLKRVKELVSARPTLAKASWDWGFGDWESALGAASHMGNRPIAEYLLVNGARPTLFSATMLGQLEVVKTFIAAQPGVQRTPGPHSISLLAHAKAGGTAAKAVYDFLQTLGDADAQPEAALADSDRTKILGKYVFGSSTNEQVDVTFDKGHLTWTRKGTTGRWLFHLGDNVFYPSGAAAVRIRFVEENGARVMTVNDPDLVLTARMRQTVL